MSETAQAADRPSPIDPRGAVAVVTGGASGIGRALCAELLGRGAHVVMADVEQAALARAIAELAAVGEAVGGSLTGVATDVTSETSTTALAGQVFDTWGRCNFLFLNAGVTSGGGGLAWQQEPNDWRWCFGVNVVGIGIGVSSFVPPMLESGAAGQVVLTSSSDGGIAPLPTASVYAASKAAVSCFAESLQHQLLGTGADVRASVFYPFGGLLDTGLYTAARNRPTELQRVSEATGRASFTFEQLVDRVTTATGRRPSIANLSALARATVDAACDRQFLLGGDPAAYSALLHQRADAIGRGELPPPYSLRLS